MPDFKSYPLSNTLPDDSVVLFNVSGETKGIQWKDLKAALVNEVHPQKRYQGEWNPAGGVWPSSTGLVDGDYYVANNTGTIKGVDFHPGDWARWNGSMFQRERHGFPSQDIFQYQGEWDASSGAPVPTATNQAWLIMQSGTFGDVDWVAGDVAVWNGVGWVRLPSQYSDLTWDGGDFNDAPDNLPNEDLDGGAL